MDASQTKLIEDSLDLAKSEAWKFYRKIGECVGMEIDDCISLGYLFLVKSIKNYDKNRSKFSTYYCLCARHWFMNQVRNREKIQMYKSQKSLYEQVTAGISEVDLADTISCETDFESKLILSDLKTRLTDIEIIITNMLYEGYTQTEIAEKLGTSQANVSRNIKKIRDKYNNKFVFDFSKYRDETQGRNERIYQMYLAGVSQNEIAKLMNITQGRVNQIIKRKKAS